MAAMVTLDEHEAHHTLDMVFQKPVGTMTATEFCLYAESSHHPLNQFILRQHFLSAFPGEDMSELTEFFDAIAQEPENYVFNIKDSKLSQIHLRDLVMIAKLPWTVNPALGERDISRISCVLTIMDKITREHRCSSVPPGSSGRFSEFASLLAPIEDRPFRLSRLLPAFDWIRSHTGGIVMREGWNVENVVTRTSWRRRFERYENLCNAHPALVRYLDPSYVFYEESAALHPVITAAITTVDNQFSVNQGLAPVAATAGVAAGGVCFRLLDAQGNINAAREIASAYRTHFSIPAASGGGPGPALRIASFSSVNMAWW